MFSQEEFKRKLESWLQNNPGCTPDEIKNYYKTSLSREEYLQNKYTLDDILTWYSVMHHEKKIEKQWYHTIDLGNGEITDGIYDHRPLLKYYGFPESLKGKRVLDVGCADGFFSFEFEKRGADKVVALDAYKNDNFLLAKEKLNSKVEYHLTDAYDLSPAKIGYFDFVFCGTVLIHLSDPFRALRNIRSVIKKGEFVCAADICKTPIEYLFFWWRKAKLFAFLTQTPENQPGHVPGYWVPTVDCLIEMMRKSGFNKIVKQGTFTLKGYSRAAKWKGNSRHVVLKSIID